MKRGVLLIFTAPSHGPCFSLPCLTQPWAPKSARASHYPREAYGMSSVPCLRQGPRTLCVPSMLASDRGQGPPVCPVSLPQTGAKDPPGAQQHVLQTDASKAFSVQQCAHEGGSVCLQVSPQEPETTRAKTHDLLLCRASGGGGAAGWRQPGLGEGILVTAGRMEDWKSRKSQDVVRVRPYGPVLWISWS